MARDAGTYRGARRQLWKNGMKLGVTNYAGWPEFTLDQKRARHPGNRLTRRIKIAEARRAGR